MRLGTSGLGVIAVVSLLVTAAPGKEESGTSNRDSNIDHSRLNRIERISRTRYSWPSRVATETSSSSVPSIPSSSSSSSSSSRSGGISSTSSSNSFVKIEFQSRGSSSPQAARSPLAHPVYHIDGNSQVSAAVSTFTTKFPTSARAFGPTQDFKNIVVLPEVLSSSFETTLQNSENLNVDSSASGLSSTSSRSSFSTTKDFQEKYVVTIESPLSTATSGYSILLPLGTRRGNRDRITISRSRRTKSRDNDADKGTATSNVEVTSSGAANSAGTMNQLLTTATSMTTRRRLLDDNFRNATKRYQVEMIKGLPDSSRNKEAMGDNLGKAHFDNGEPNTSTDLKSNLRIMYEGVKDAFYSNYRHSTNYPAAISSTVDSMTQNEEPMNGDSENSGVKRHGGNQNVNKSTNHFFDGSVLINNLLQKLDDSPRQESLVGDEVPVEHHGLTVRSIERLSTRKRETLGYSTVTEEIVQAKQMTTESSLVIPTIVRPFSRVPGLLNTNSSDAATSYDTSLDYQKAVRIRSYQTVLNQQEQEQQQQQQQHQRAVNLESPVLSSRWPDVIGVKGAIDVTNVGPGTRIERPAMPVNKIVIPKSAYSVTKNHSKPSINLVDGKGNKIFYEIKPSLITEMDHSDSFEVTTPRRNFEKFLLPSVPSAYGKFGPYFLDEEDRRNVTERIGNTVQLDCRIGLLGQRKVTWVQHYKDSFRLLTVEKESYSVDRRISLNFQYPDNWRLQIAYASLRDSGLYKCQVEIDPDRPLVKRYNVIITAPTLTITDDSGRPVSGERHLKAGSALKLKCEARDVIQRLNESVLWMRGDETLTEDVSENRTTETSNENELTVVVSTLVVERATPRHAGNYSCVVPDKAKTTIAVHVLNGELPAAVQHGSGVSTAVLNLWLIHLTASYGFFR